MNILNFIENCFLNLIFILIIVLIILFLNTMKKVIYKKILQLRYTDEAIKKYFNL